MSEEKNQTLQETIEQNGMNVYMHLVDLIKVAPLKESIKQQYSKELFERITLISKKVQLGQIQRDREFKINAQELALLIRRIYLSAKTYSNSPNETKEKGAELQGLAKEIIQYFILLGDDIDLNDW